MLESAGVRLLVVGLLTLVLAIPALFVADIIDARADYNRATSRSVGAEWGGPQTLAGPVIRIPVTEQVTVEERRPVIDPDTGIQQTDKNGIALVRLVDVERTETRAPLFLLPDEFVATLDLQTETRSRGIFSVPVYAGELDAQFAFDFNQTSDRIGANEDLDWEGAELLLHVTSNRALRGEASLLQQGEPVLLEPWASTGQDGVGLRAPLGDPRVLGPFELKLGIFGSDHFNIAPVGRSNSVTMSADWSHPSFRGAFLPGRRTVTETGFSANWEIPHLARAVAQSGRENPVPMLKGSTTFGVSLYQPNDFYQKSWRAARYGLLFVALTFLGIFLLERRQPVPAHPVQYLMVGVSQLVFFLLMLALAEQIGFGWAYFAASAATIGLVTAYCGTALRLGKAGFGLCAGLCTLYAVIYLILQSTDYALLAGAALSFVAVAGTMWMTRNEDWYSGGGATGILSRLLADPRPPQQQNG